MIRPLSANRTLQVEVTVLRRMERTQFAWPLRLWKITPWNPYWQKEMAGQPVAKAWAGDGTISKRIHKGPGSHLHRHRVQNWYRPCASSCSGLRTMPPSPRTKAYLQPMAQWSQSSSQCIKRGVKELQGAFCLRLSRINGDSCRVLKVRTLIYHGFKRVSCGVLCW